MPRLSPHRRRLAAALVAALGCAGVALPAVAKPSLRDLERRAERAEAAAARLDERGDNLSALVAELDERRVRVEAEVVRLQHELDALDARIEAKRKQLAEAQKRMAILTIELQEILEDLAARTDLFVDRAVAAYMAGPTAYVEGVLSSESFTDLVDRYEYYQSALDADSALIDEISVLRDGLETRRAEVERRQNEIAEAKLQLQIDRQSVDAIHDQRAAVLAEKRAIVAEKRSILSNVRGKQRYWERLQARAESQIDALRLSMSSGPLPSGGGQLLWPAAGAMTSGFGYRTHPIFGDTRMHTGIDIAAPYGAPVIAADRGTVVFAGVMSGYGNAIVIDHGGGLATTYNHLSSFLVATGSSVGRGSQIGAVGCTGYCTGPHLHFEVRVNGSPVDPMPYLQ
ncbi:MAG: peptidoglycan DD-metalloendopeptidase family protein [Actinomycetota bacterium]|nr:peptidoglycan DD-metalloendopeptidase family protein [Actinomycetota bacterium]